jgi:hypothetical protein
LNVFFVPFKILIINSRLTFLCQGGAKDPFKYVAAEFYDGPDKASPNVLNNQALLTNYISLLTPNMQLAPQPRTADKKTIRIACKIHAFLLETKQSLTEAEIRGQIGDNTGTGTALRYSIAQQVVIHLRIYHHRFCPGYLSTSGSFRKMD